MRARAEAVTHSLQKNILTALLRPQSQFAKKSCFIRTNFQWKVSQMGTVYYCFQSKWLIRQILYVDTCTGFLVVVVVVVHVSLLYWSAFNWGGDVVMQGSLD